MEKIKFVLKSIRELREEKGISQLELSQKTFGRVPQGLISELESGSRHLTGYTAYPLIEALDNVVSAKDLILGQEMANAGIPLSERHTVFKAVLDEPDLLGASKSINRVKSLDFGNRDAFGRKLPKKEVEARKRAEKSKDLDFGNRDALGRKRVAIKRYDDLTPEEYENLSYEEKLKILLMKGEERK